MRRVSNKSKWMVAMSLVVSAALIATLAVYAARGGANAWYIAGMVVLAVAVAVAFALARLWRGRVVQALTGEYFAAYEQVCDALGATGLGWAEQREVKRDVLAMLTAGQAAGRPAGEVTGGDAMAFVERVKGAFGYRSSFLFAAMATIQYGVFFVAFIHTLAFLSDYGKFGYFETQISVSLALMFVPIIFVIYPVLRSQMRKKKTMWPFALPLVYGALMIGLMILMDNVFGADAGVRWFLDTQVVMIFSWWMLVVLAGAAALAQLGKWVLRRRSIRKLD